MTISILQTAAKTAALTILTLLATTPVRAAAWPVAAGSFVQDWLVKTWPETKWSSEFANMKQAGMDTLVFQSVCDSKAGVTYYPTSISGLHEAAGYDDTLGKCLRAAEKSGIKVFVGLNFSSDWWAKGASDATWLNGQMATGNSIADEVYSRYHASCPHSLAGWYWVWEVDNANFNTTARKTTLAAALDLNVAHLHSLTPSLPVMLSPFMNEALGAPAAYRDLWTWVFAHCSLGPGDVFCPQDSVGAGGVALGNVASWFSALKGAVDTKPGLVLWSDTETFNGDDYTSATLDRVVAQMKAVQPYVARSITFAYCHYNSPTIIDAAMQCTWMGYNSNGVLDASPPTRPGSFKAVRLSNGSVQLTWTPSTDDMRVLGYEILRGGTLISRKQVAHSDPPTLDNPPSYTDSAAPATGTLTYRIRAYDFAGNFSAPAFASPPAT
jgi:hypothetical protein